MFLRDKKKKRERILALDLLRGTFLVVIFVNHMAWAPTIYDLITGQSHLFASAAEGFFAISGILVGYIYISHALRDTKQMFVKLFKRAGWLYLLSIGFTTLYTVITLFLPPDTVRGQFLQPNVWEFLYRTLTLQFSYGWADFLSRYAVLMLFAPFVVWLVAKHKEWLVVALSVAIWLFLGGSQFNNYTAWQLIFFISIIIGAHLPAIERWVTARPAPQLATARTILFTTAAFTYILSIILTVVLPTIVGEYQNSLSQAAYINMIQIIDVRHYLDQTFFNRDTLAVGRLFIGTIWFVSLYVIYRRYEAVIDKKTKGSLLLLGTNSLYVYGLQSFILFMMDIFLKPPQNASLILKTFVVTCAVILVYVLTVHRANIRGYRKRILRV